MYMYVVHTTYNVYFNIYIHLSTIHLSTFLGKPDGNVYLNRSPAAKRRGRHWAPPMSVMRSVTRGGIRARQAEPRSEAEGA